MTENPWGDFGIYGYEDWEKVPVGVYVEKLELHGKVVETNVDPLFCAHKFEDGTVHSRGRKVQVRLLHKRGEYGQTRRLVERYSHPLFQQDGFESTVLDFCNECEQFVMDMEEHDKLHNA